MDRQSDSKSRQRDRQSVIQIYSEVDKLTVTWTERQTDVQTEAWTDRRMGRWLDGVKGNR